MSATPAPPAPLVADPSRPLRAVLFGVQHSHAAGKARAMAAHPQVDLVGAYEADPAARARAQDNPAFAGLRWFDAPDEFLADPEVAVACVEGAEGRCSDLALQAVEAGKHIWYDKPAGDWPVFQQVVEGARRQGLHVQMGYMLRYHAAFRQIEGWARSGLLGHLYAVRGHMSTYYPGRHPRAPALPWRGGLPALLAHDRPHPDPLRGPPAAGDLLPCATTPPPPSPSTPTTPWWCWSSSGAWRRSTSPPWRPRPTPGASRSTAPGAAPSSWSPSSRAPPCASAWWSPARDSGRASSGWSCPPLPARSASAHELNAFVDTLTGRQAPDRTLDHELLVEETLHRAVGTIAP